MLADPIETLKDKAQAFGAKLKDIRASSKPDNGSPWYPHESLSNIWALDQVLAGAHRSLLADAAGKKIADVGCADGDMGFFLASLGAKVDLIDNPPTNMNGLRGAHRIREALDAASVGIIECDLDSQFQIDGDYDFALFLGLLYHLKNPFYVLEQLAKRVSTVLLSTRVTAYSAPVDAPGRTHIDTIPAAYLLDPYESNNDPTNYWIFTGAGLRRLLERTGWKILDYKVLGVSAEQSDPARVEGDQRAFCLLRSARR